MVSFILLLRARFFVSLDALKLVLVDLLPFVLGDFFCKYSPLLAVLGMYLSGRNVPLIFL